MFIYNIVYLTYIVNELRFVAVNLFKKGFYCFWLLFGIFCLLLFFSELLVAGSVLFQCLISWVLNFLFFISFSHQLVILTLFSKVLLFVLISCAICYILVLISRGVVIYHTFFFYFSFLFVSLMSFILFFSSPPLFVIMFLWVFLKKWKSVM